MKPGERPLIPLQGLRAGLYRYIEGSEAQLVYVNFVEGTGYATFVDAEEEDEGVTVPIGEMVGRFEYVGGQR